MESLNFVIDADCAPAIGALDRTSQGIDSLGGKKATVGIETRGGSQAVRELQSVNEARAAAAGDVRVGMDTSGLRDGRAELGGLRNDFRQASNEMDSLAGERRFGFSGTGSVRSLADDLQGASRGMGAFNNEASRSESAMGRTSSMAGQTSDHINSMGNEAQRSEGAFQSLGSSGERSMGGLSGHTQELNRAVAETRGNLALAQRDFEGLGSALQPGSPTERSLNSINAATRTTPSGVPLRGVPAAPSGAPSGVPSAPSGAPGPGGVPRAPNGQFQSAFQARRNAQLQAQGLPPQYGGGGGGGGGGRGGGGRGAGGAGDADEGEGLAVPRRAGHMALMGGAVGIMESLLVGAGGMAAAAETIKQVPDLALAANNAMGQLSKGIRETGMAAIGEGVPALHQLGGTLHSLGSEVGAVGVEHLGQTLAAASSLADTATKSIAALDPAVSSSIAGLQGVGNALMTGISSPTSVQGIRSVGQALADAGNDTGIKNLTSGIGTLAPIAGKVLTDVAGDVGNLPGMGNANIGPALQGGLSAGIMTKSPWIGGMAALATWQAQKEEEAGRQDLVTPGILGGVGGAMGASGIAKSMGIKGPKAGALGLAGYLGGDLIGSLAAEGDKKLGTGSLLADVGQGALMGAGIGAYAGPWGAAGGALIGAGLGFAKNELSGDSDTGTTGATVDDNGFPTGVSAPYGWNRDDQGNLSPSRSASDTGTGRYTPPASTRPSASESRFPGQIGAPRTPPPAPAAPPSYGPPLKDQGDGARSLGDSLQKLGPQVSSAIPPAQNLGQQYQRSSEQIQRMPEMMKPTMAALSTVPAQMNTAMASASRNVDEGGQAIGSQVPKSMATGVQKNTNQACNAAADMGNSTVKCAKSALDSASPSKKFVELGEGIGQGLAIGVRTSSGDAAASVGASMAQVVQAGQAGLQAASPSRTFQAMGQQMMQQAGKAMAQSGNQAQLASGGRLAQPGGAQQTAALKQQLAQQKQNSDLQNQSTKGQSESQKAQQAAHDAYLRGNAMDYSSPRAQANIMAHNRSAEERLAQRDVRHQDAKEASRQGITPNQAAAQRIQSEQRQMAEQRAQENAGRPSMYRSDQNRGAVEQMNSVTAQGLNHQSGLQQANDGGKNMVGSLVAGMNSQSGKAAAAGANAASAASGGTKKKAKINSPSEVMAEYGRNMVEGLALGLMANSGNVGAAGAGLVSQVTTQIDANGMSGFAATGLKLGFVMGENLVSGAQQVVQKNLLQSLTTPQGLDQRAMAALAGTGLGAPAGSGASTWAQPQGLVSFAGAGSAANPISAPATIGTPPPTEQVFHLYLDAKPFQTIAQTEVEDALSRLMERIPRQRG